MSAKRKRGDGDDTGRSHKDQKRARKGFQVGPANLPDGVYKRKTQKIKESLIERAQIKRQYAKVKQQVPSAEDRDVIPIPASMQNDPKGSVVENEGNDNAPESSQATHPARQAMISSVPEPNDDQQPTETSQHSKWERRRRKPKVEPFKREHEQAQKRKEEAEARRQVRENAAKEREQKRAERERLRKAMAKARVGGPNGQRKLGRESNVLLEKVKRMVGSGG